MENNLVQCKIYGSDRCFRRDAEIDWDTIQSFEYNKFLSYEVRDDAVYIYLTPLAEKIFGKLLER